MKKLILPVCLLLAGVITAGAQGFSVGARIGLNIANQSLTASGLSVSPSSKIGYLIGGYAKIMFNDKMGIQPELFLSSVGTKYPASLFGTEATARLNYISIPVFFRYNITDNFHLLGGPQLGILASAKGIVSGQPDTDIKSDFSSSDFGATLGAGVDFGPFNAGLRYNFSFSNIASDSGDFSGVTVKNNAIQLVAGYKLFGK